jgi:hypothetical protein
MILLALAAAALVQWTGPRTVEYVGPGNFCGGGYRIALGRGERALILPQGQAPQATRLVLSGGEVNIRTGARSGIGRVVLNERGSSVAQANVNGQITYFVSDETPYGLSVTSDAFKGFKLDRWFFSHANFSSDADRGVECLSGRSN